MDGEFWKDGIVLLDGAMGTVLQQKGLPPGGQPALLNFTDPQLLQEVHRAYVEAGSRVVYANTFGANGKKLAGTGRSVGETVAAGVAIARRAVAGTGAAVALDVGPIGELLEPMGRLTFEEAYDLFAEVMEAGETAGADLVAIETMTDLYETRAALLAAKERTHLPVFVTMSFDETGRTFTGCSAEAMARTLEGLGADAVGLNCSMGPDKLAGVVAQISRSTRLPVIAKPNAGLPDPVTGRYGMSPEEFARGMAACLEAGATVLGGCCGTSPEYIRALARAVAGKTPPRREFDDVCVVCTPTRTVRLDRVRVIGERINPTGKKRLQQALLEEDLDYLLDLAVRQEDAGAEILDVNVGCPGVDEIALLPKVVKKLQSAVDLPLQIDSADPAALEAALRVYNGKGAVNSVNGEKKSRQAVLPIVKKYGAAVVGLCLDEDGLPDTAQKRMDIARTILEDALARGIPREDVWIDCLTLTVSAQQSQAAETLEAVRRVRRELGLRTVLGVSNISFGLPQRGLITQNFLSAALWAGLSLPILNPNQTEMMDTVAAYQALSGEDGNCQGYVERFAGAQTAVPTGAPGPVELEEAIVRGLRGEAGSLAREALSAGADPLELVENRLIPALDRVGEGYEKGTLFLPQLLSAAQAAQAVFQVVKEAAPSQAGGDKVLAVATVRGDIHDIGKNIVKTVLENYGYQVRDLGRDVPAEEIRRVVEREGIPLVGLSALMTTTLPAMEETVRQLKELPHPPVVWVGGAVVTADYAKRIGADHYAKDAKESREIAREVLG